MLKSISLCVSSSSVHPREFTNREISWLTVFCDQLSLHTQFSSSKWTDKLLVEILSSCVQLGYVALDKRICKSKIIIFHFQSNLTNAGSFKNEKIKYWPIPIWFPIYCVWWLWLFENFECIPQHENGLNSSLES